MKKITLVNGVEKKRCMLKEICEIRLKLFIIYMVVWVSSVQSVFTSKP